MKNNTFITTFKKTNFFQKLCSNPKIIMIYIGGSRLWGAENENSDFDICILSKEESKINMFDITIDYEGIFGHFYYDNITELFINLKDPSKWYRCYRGISLGILKDENILYINNKYNALINYIKNNKDNIFDNALYLTLKNQEKEFLSKCSLTTFDEEKFKPKYLYHLLMYSYKLVNETPNLELVYLTKNSKDGIFTQEQKEKMVERFNILKEFYETFIPNVENIQQEVNRLLNDEEK